MMFVSDSLRLEKNSFVMFKNILYKVVVLKKKNQTCRLLQNFVFL